jgi:hypothetical protein
MITPASAYAAHGGLGGKVKSFSPFGAVDPGVSIVVFPVTGIRDVTLIALQANGGAPGLTYTWDFGDGTTDTGISVSHAFTRNGTIPVRVRAVGSGSDVTVSTSVTIGSLDGVWRMENSCCTTRLFITQRGSSLDGQWQITFPPGSPFGGPADTTRTGLSGTLTNPFSVVLMQLGECLRVATGSVSSDLKTITAIAVPGNAACGTFPNTYTRE